jgi:hypothetical protein
MLSSDRGGGRCFADARFRTLAFMDTCFCGALRFAPHHKRVREREPTPSKKITIFKSAPDPNCPAISKGKTVSIGARRNRTPTVIAAADREKNRSTYSNPFVYS